MTKQNKKLKLKKIKIYCLQILNAKWLCQHNSHQYKISIDYNRENKNINMYI